MVAALRLLLLLEEEPWICDSGFPVSKGTHPPYLTPPPQLHPIRCFTKPYTIFKHPKLDISP